MYKFDTEKYIDQIKQILISIDAQEEFNKHSLRLILQKSPKDGCGLFSKDNLMRGYRFLVDNGEMEPTDRILSRIQMKPTRTMSGVVPVTVLTKPFHCPGKCIFCPLEENMPKSYLRDEPGAQRAARSEFSPYDQVHSRLQALQNIGHPTGKVELIVLGGTWSYYPKMYQVWFIRELFRAVNDFSGRTPIQEVEPNRIFSKVLDKFYWESLIKEHVRNESAVSRVVGLSIETRPDFITKREVIRLRSLGCTKIQIGVQSTDDNVLKLNKRGHNHSVSVHAVDILRSAGFKIQIHYMPNLYGSTPQIDVDGYKKLYNTGDILPDEIKLYPTSIIKDTGLYDLWKQGKYKPYSEHSLLNVLINCLDSTHEFTRLSRVIRDIPSTYIEAGNKKTNLREMAELRLKKLGKVVKDIRAREIRDNGFNIDDLKLKTLTYKTNISIEKFLQFVTSENKIVGFLRLSLPDSGAQFIEEIKGNAMIREIHIYGISQNVNRDKNNKPQHLGLGSSLIKKASAIAKTSGYKKLSVISAIGTRQYYRGRGFVDGGLYQHKNL